MATIADQPELPLELPDGTPIHPVTCACGGSGVVTVVDSDGESAYGTACPADTGEQLRPAA